MSTDRDRRTGEGRGEPAPAAPQAGGVAPERPTWLAGVLAGRLRGTDLRALRLFLLTRIVVGILVAASGWLFVWGDDPTGPRSFWEGFDRWDWRHLQKIAEHGYGGHPPGTGDEENLEAFFPGFPLAVRAVHVLVPNWVLAGLVVSFVAGAVAVVALARLAEREYHRGSGERAVLFLLLAPSAVFLAAGYTESLFLAFAIPAWLAARRGQWWLAGLLAAGACTTRVTGAFLAVALVVEFVFAGDRRRRWHDAAWLALPALPVFGYMAYLRSRTGDWLAWLHAQEDGWHRTFTNPVVAFQRTWQAAQPGDPPGQPVGYAWMFRAEILALLVGVILVVWLLSRQRWAESVYVGLQVAAFATSFWYISVTRATLLWWPLWIGLAWWSLRRPAVLTAYLTLLAPFMVVFTVLFTQYRWVG